MEKFTSSFIQQHRDYLCAMLDALKEAKEIAKESEQCKHLYDEYVTNITSTGKFILGTIKGHHYIRDNAAEVLCPPVLAQCKAISKSSSTWVYGCVVESDDCFEIRDNEYYYHEVYSNTIGQFFGKYDKNGIKIYTGDILLFRESTNAYTYYQVCYDLCSAMYVGKNDISGAIPISDILHNSEVVGNIHIVNVIDPDGYK